MKDLSVADLRRDEARYRARGKFDLALMYQRQADLEEAGVQSRSPNAICQWMDRGAVPEIVGGRIGLLFAFELPSGLAWALTEDKAKDLLGWLVAMLDLDPEVYSNLALMAQRRRDGVLMEEL